MQSHWNFIFLYVSTFLKIKCWRRTHLVTVGKRSCFHLKYMTLLAQRRLQNVPMVAKMTGYNRKLTSPNEKVSTVWQWYDQIVEMLIWYMWNLQIYRICGLQKGPLPVSHLIWSSLNWCLSVKKKEDFCWSSVSVPLDCCETTWPGGKSTAVCWTVFSLYILNLAGRTTSFVRALSSAVWHSLCFSAGSAAGQGGGERKRRGD